MGIEPTLLRLIWTVLYDFIRVALRPTLATLAFYKVTVQKARSRFYQRRTLDTQNLRVLNSKVRLVFRRVGGRK